MCLLAVVVLVLVVFRTVIFETNVLLRKSLITNGLNMYCKIFSLCVFRKKKKDLERRIILSLGSIFDVGSSMQVQKSSQSFNC